MRLAEVLHDLLFNLVHWSPAFFRRCVMQWAGARAAGSVSAFIDRQCLVLAAVARIRVDRTCPRVLIAGRLGQMLSLNRLSLCGRMSLPRLSGTFVSFCLSTLGLGGLLVS